MRTRLTTCAVFCLAVSVRVYADSFSITNISTTTNGISLSWSNPTNLYIVAQSPSLTTGTFQYVGNVLSTNGATMTNSLATCFYRIREVQAVQFPDLNLEWCVWTNLPPVKRSPAWNQIYDIDAEVVTNLNAPSVSIANATGIRALTGLQTLNLSGNLLSNLNVSGCTSLQTLSCDQNQLTNLNASGCTRLQYLACWENQLTNLNVSGCTNLQYLACSENQLTNLNVSGCTNLQMLYCGLNDLTNLDVSGCTSLTNLSCGPVNYLTSLDVSRCASLQYLSCWANPLTNLNLSGCTNLRTLICEQNHLTILNISSNKALTDVEASMNPLLTNIVVWWNPPLIANKPSSLATFTYDGSPTFTYSP